jgi:hypothetical protein
MAEAARHYAQVSGLGLEAQNYATEIKLRAERRMGEMLQETALYKGGRPGQTGNHRDTGLSDAMALPALRWDAQQKIVTMLALFAFLSPQHCLTLALHDINPRAGNTSPPYPLTRLKHTLRTPKPRRRNSPRRPPSAVLSLEITMPPYTARLIVLPTR